MAISVKQNRIERPRYRRALFPMVCGFAFLAFLAAPWPLEHKAHVFLHGLCAQRPSHTLLFGGQPLPFDARMTGIYSGFLLAAAILIAQKKHRAAELPGIPTAIVLGLLVAAMAIDGFNSLFLDLDLPHLYRPSNPLRLFTGAGMGVVLAVALAYLVGISLWRRPNFKKPVVDLRGLTVLCVAQIPLLFYLTGWSALLVPITLILLIGAVSVISTLALVTLVLATRADNSFGDAGDLQGYGSLGFVLGLVAIAGLAALRFLYERHFGPSPLV